MGHKDHERYLRHFSSGDPYWQQNLEREEKEIREQEQAHKEAVAAEREQEKFRSQQINEWMRQERTRHKAIMKGIKRGESPEVAARKFEEASAARAQGPSKLETIRKWAIIAAVAFVLLLAIKVVSSFESSNQESQHETIDGSLDADGPINVEAYWSEHGVLDDNQQPQTMNASE